jgi:hypothetical protein
MTYQGFGCRALSPDLKGFLQKRFGLGVVAHGLVQLRQVVEAGGRAASLRLSLVQAKRGKYCVCYGPGRQDIVC